MTDKDKSKWEVLAEIQSELNVPKDKYNDYGEFLYRSYEDIVEAVKPICANHRTTLVVSDTIEECGGWHYVKASAELVFWDTGESIEATAYAREAESKKGSDVSQVTGMASTYARKYALCGLFSIDGQDDADSMDNTPQNPPKRATGTKKQSNKATFWGMLQAEANKYGLDPKQGAEALKNLRTFKDDEKFYAKMVIDMTKSPSGVMSLLYPDTIQEV